MIFAYTLRPLLEDLEDAPDDALPEKLFLGVPGNGWHDSIAALKAHLRAHGAVLLEVELPRFPPSDEVLFWRVDGGGPLLETHVFFVPGIRA